MNNSKLPIYKACWSEWGRESRGCDGWGLCNFQGAWIWQDKYDDICNFNSGGSGTIEFDNVTGKYNLVIELDVVDSVENSAITSQEKFYVDEDVIFLNPYDDWNKLTVKRGIYSFDVEIGDFGGYSVGVIRD